MYEKNEGQRDNEGTGDNGGTRDTNGGTRDVRFDTSDERTNWLLDDAWREIRGLKAENQRLREQRRLAPEYADVLRNLADDPDIACIESEAIRAALAALLAQ